VLDFATERSTFANDNVLQELQANGVAMNANPPNQGTPLWEELLLWFGRPCCSAACSPRGCAAAGRALDGLGGMGKSKARRYDPGSVKRTAAGISSGTVPAAIAPAKAG
jgi:hypothetical protein